MASFNRIIIAGNLTRDPELKQLASGQAVCRLGIASNRQFRNRQNGEMVQEVCYVDVDVWGAQAESCRQYLQKGRPVLIEGRLKLDSWQDQEGHNRSKHSIVADRVVFLSGAGAGAEDRSEDMSMTSTGGNEPVAPRNAAESDAFSQLNDVKARLQSRQQEEASFGKPAKRAPAPRKSVMDEAGDEGVHAAAVTFKDEPPFDDELPF